jgi:Mce-associated membrane protein
VVDADPVDEPSQDTENAADRERTLALVEEAEAEAAEAEAAAAAARARARAIRLRREATDTQPAESAAADGPAEEDEVATEVAVPADVEDSTDAAEDSADVETVDFEDAAAAEGEPARKRRRLRRFRLPWKGIAVTLALLASGALIAASGYMVWNHKQVQAEQQRRAEFAAAGRQGVVTLMSLDFNHVRDDVKRIVDNTTGDFKKDFQASVEDFTRMAQESKVVTEATVNATAVERMSDSDTKATVLVAVTTRVTNTAGSNQEPRPWRLAVDLVREGDQIKMSKVEFVP